MFVIIQDRIPMIDPHVPDSIYYRTKSMERAARRADKARRTLLEKQALLPSKTDKRCK